ncbi:septum site-determining protein MinC [Diplocloster agilis]|uniref:Probable septum site-determining protein MinC n=1 Tax=Diplocloster agilis TaxID=2850323 RepID=A0A949JUG1_9FIRM|nr:MULTISPECIES: septum site-determining protein MinC [Lachnospiraceae]MBU9735335.1 septum site-determining protein MinC [Diplocloster agilis]MBU9743377.1 septum site-determining protein MinC [Diplocloster agilis]MCU6733935.1 septum site-determining protein MinC [Suonthocola fibrivorans]SCJ15805.1 Septum site-determining protein MinC [uncultured Clostridium sp.]
MNQPVIIKSNRYGIIVILDRDMPFPELLEKIAEKFRDSAKFFKDAQMAVSFEGRKLSEEEIGQALEAISENSDIKILCVVDTDLQKEQEFKKSLDEKLNEISAHDGQFYKGTLRSGQVLESETSIIILGDVNPGAKVIAKGNIVILGAFKGNAYAGANGNQNAFVAALSMHPMQIRIGDVIARCPDESHKKSDNEPKISYVEDGNIYIEPITKESIGELNL